MLVSKGDIVGIFDMDNCTGSARTRDFLARAERAGQVVDVSGALPKAFALVCKPGRGARRGQRVYLSQLAPATLLKRWDTLV